MIPNCFYKLNKLIWNGLKKYMATGGMKNLRILYTNGITHLGAYQSSDQACWPTVLGNCTMAMKYIDLQHSWKHRSSERNS